MCVGGSTVVHFFDVSDETAYSDGVLVQKVIVRPVRVGIDG